MYLLFFLNLLGYRVCILYYHTSIDSSSSTSSDESDEIYPPNSEDVGNTDERVSKTDIANNLKSFNCTNLKAADLIDGRFKGNFVNPNVTNLSANLSKAEISFPSKRLKFVPTFRNGDRTTT